MFLFVRSHARYIVHAVEDINAVRKTLRQFFRKYLVKGVHQGIVLQTGVPHPVEQAHHVAGPSRLAGEIHFNEVPVRVREGNRLCDFQILFFV